LAHASLTQNAVNSTRLQISTTVVGDGDRATIGVPQADMAAGLADLDEAEFGESLQNGAGGNRRDGSGAHAESWTSKGTRAGVG
jgi:hypothetical protein